MRTKALCMLLGCLALTAPASAQHIELAIDNGTIAKVTTTLKLRGSAPKWWNWNLPEETGTLKVDQEVTVLGQTWHNTLLGQHGWFRVRTNDCQSDSPDNRCEEKYGWVLGSDDGQLFLDVKSLPTQPTEQ